MSNKYIKSLTANFEVLQVGSFIRFADGSKLESSTVSQTGFSDKASVTPSAAVANPIDLGQYRLYSTPQAMYLCMQDPQASTSDDSNLLGYSVLATFSPVDKS